VSFTYDRLILVTVLFFFCCIRFVCIYARIAVFLYCYRLSVDKDLYMTLWSLIADWWSVMVQSTKRRVSIISTAIVPTSGYLIIASYLGTRVQPFLHLSN